MLHKVFTGVRPKYPLEGQGGVIMDADTKRFLHTQMIWIAISLVISLALSFLLPFPLSLITIVGVFLVMNYYIRRWQMRRMGMMSGSTSGGGFGSLLGGSGGGLSY